MKILMGLHREMLLFQDLELRWALLMSDQMVRFIEDLRYEILSDSHMGRFIEKLGKEHWEGYLVQILDMIEAIPFG